MMNKQDKAIIEKDFLEYMDSIWTMSRAGVQLWEYSNVNNVDTWWTSNDETVIYLTPDYTWGGHRAKICFKHGARLSHSMIKPIFTDYFNMLSRTHNKYNHHLLAMHDYSIGTLAQADNNRRIGLWR